MSYVLDHAATTDAYPTQLGQGASLRCAHTVRLTVDVEDAPVYMQLGEGSRGVEFSQPEVRRGPAIYTFERACDAVRFRSAIPGLPARVSVEAATEQDVGA